MSEGRDVGSARSFPHVQPGRGALGLPEASEKVSREPGSGVNLLSLLPK